MNKTILTATIMLSIGILAVLPVQAETKTATVVWAYDSDKVPDLAGFRLYLNGVPACDFTGPDVRQAQCGVTITTEPASFTMTAYDRAGHESAHSAAYTLDLPPGPVPYSLEIVIHIQ